MPIGKEIHNVFSKKYKQKQKKLAELEQKARIEGPDVPAKVEQWKKNTVARATSTNTHITELVGPKPKRRQMSPNEGKAAVNGKAGPDIEKKNVHAPKPKVKKLDPTAGAIPSLKPKTSAPKKAKRAKKRQCGICRETNHNARTCPKRGS